VRSEGRGLVLIEMNLMGICQCLRVVMRKWWCLCLEVLFCAELGVDDDNTERVARLGIHAVTYQHDYARRYPWDCPCYCH